MIGYIAQGPAQSRYQNIKLRIAAFNVEDSVLDKLKVVVQVFDADGTLIPEDPIALEYMTHLDLVAYLSESRRQGWHIEPCQITQQLIERTAWDNHRRSMYRAILRERNNSVSRNQTA